MRCGRRQRNSRMRGQGRPAAANRGHSFERRGLRARKQASARAPTRRESARGRGSHLSSHKARQLKAPAVRPLPTDVAAAGAATCASARPMRTTLCMTGSVVVGRQ